MTGGEQPPAGGVRPVPADIVSGAGADGVAQGLNRGAEPGPGLPRRRLLLAGAGLLSTVGLGAVVWEASRPDAAQPRTTAMREPPARRAAATRPPAATARRAVIWQAKVSVPRPQIMAAAGGLVCVAGDEGVYFNPGTARDMVQALNAGDGSHMWTFTVRTGVRGMGFADPPGLAAGQGYVYVAVDRLYCLRAGDGAEVWSDPYPLTVNLAAGPDAVYAVQATLFALSSRDGTRLWSFAANAGAMPAPLLADGIIYVLGYGTAEQRGGYPGQRRRQTMGLTRPGRGMAGLRREDRLRRVRRRPRRPDSGKRRAATDPDVDLPSQRRQTAVPISS